MLGRCCLEMDCEEETGESSRLSVKQKALLLLHLIVSLCFLAAF